MKISDIKTEKDLMKFGDIFYQRSAKLQAIFKDENQPKERREKALLLNHTLFLRCSKILGLVTEYRSKAYKPKNFPEGGIIRKA